MTWITKDYKVPSGRDIPVSWMHIVFLEFLTWVLTDFNICSEKRRNMWHHWWNKSFTTWNGECPSAILWVLWVSVFFCSCFVGTWHNESQPCEILWKPSAGWGAFRCGIIALRISYSTRFGIQSLRWACGLGVSVSKGWVGMYWNSTRIVKLLAKGTRDCNVYKVPNSLRSSAREKGRYQGFIVSMWTLLSELDKAARYRVKATFQLGFPLQNVLPWRLPGWLIMTDLIWMISTRGHSFFDFNGWVWRIWMRYDMMN